MSWRGRFGEQCAPAQETGQTAKHLEQLHHGKDSTEKQAATMKEKVAELQVRSSAVLTRAGECEWLDGGEPRPSGHSPAQIDLVCVCRHSSMRRACTRNSFAKQSIGKCCRCET